MAMVVNNWHDHSSHHSSDDVSSLAPLAQPAIDPVTTPPHHQTLPQAPSATIPPPPQLHQAPPPMQSEPSTLTRPPHTPTTPGNGSVSDGSNAASLVDCSSQPQPQQPSSSSTSEKPQIECVVSSVFGKIISNLSSNIDCHEKNRI